MMRSAFLTTLLSLVLSGPAQAQTTLPEAYLASLKGALEDCAIHYTAQSYLNGKLLMDASGVMAFKNDLSYDSSNYRFALKSKNWVIIADHANKTMRAVYLPVLRKQIGNVNFDFTSQMMDPSAFFNYASLDRVKGAGDTIRVILRYSPEKSSLRSLTLYYLPQATIPSRYEGVVEFTDAEKKAPDVAAHKTGAGNNVTRMVFNCYRIELRPPIQLFDEDRIVKLKGTKASIPRYADYKVYR